LYATIGALGIVYNKDGSVAARFSDFACYDYGNGGKPFQHAQTSADSPSFDTWMIPDRYETQIDLPPGDYDIRVVLSDGEKFGRAQQPLTVDTYDGKQLAISKIALSRRIRELSSGSLEAPAKIPGSFVPLVSDGTEFTPSVNTSFKKDETLYAYFEIYEPQLAGQSATRVQLNLRIIDTKTGEVKSDVRPVDATPYIKAGSPLVAIGRGIKLTSLRNGSYRLEIQATDSLGKSTIWCAANFSVE
jgi:hypothetical protein